MGIRIDALDPALAALGDHVLPVMRLNATYKLTINQVVEFSKATLMDRSVYDPQNKHADAFARANHTGSQAISTITNLQTSLDDKQKLVHTSTAKTSLVDADEIGGADSAASFGPVRFSLANLVTSIFTAARTIANATFAGATFRLRNAATAFYLNWDVSTITVSRTISFPDADVDLGLMAGGEASVTLSGTSLDITGIPAGVNRIVIAMEVALSGAASIATLQLGTTGGIVTTGYSGVASGIGAASVASIPATGSAALMATSGTPYIRPVIHLIRQQGTRWLISGMGPLDTTGATVITNSMVTLGAALDRVRISTQGGSTLNGTAIVRWSKV